MPSIRDALKSLQNWSRRRRFREGKLLSQFIAKDVRRDILIVSTARIDEGIISGRVRTTNVLYASRNLVAPAAPEPARELHIDTMWQWTGQDWGGLPDGTSIAEHYGEQPSGRPPAGGTFDDG